MLLLRPKNDQSETATIVRVAADDPDLHDRVVRESGGSYTVAGWLDSLGYEQIGVITESGVKSYSVDAPFGVRSIAEQQKVPDGLDAIVDAVVERLGGAMPEAEMPSIDDIASAVAEKLQADTEDDDS